MKDMRLCFFQEENIVLLFDVERSLLVLYGSVVYRADNTKWIVLS